MVVGRNFICQRSSCDASYLCERSLCLRRDTGFSLVSSNILPSRALSLLQSNGHIGAIDLYLEKVSYQLQVIFIILFYSIPLIS